MMPPLLIAQLLLAQNTIRPQPPTNPGLPSMASPETSEEGVRTLINVLAQGAFIISTTLAVAGVMYGGFLIIRGGDKIDAGRKAIAYALGGLVVIALAYAIVRIVTGIDLANPSLGIRS